VKSTVFLGGGRITSALIAGLQLAKYKTPIVVHDRHLQKLRDLKRRHGVSTEPDLQNALSQAGLLVIAVRPSSVNELLQEIGKIRRPLTAVSLAAGIPLARLQKNLGPPVRWARAMPSPVCRNAHGLTAITISRGMSARERTLVRKLFSSVGAVLEIAESQFDAFTVTYSSSHGYHALAALAKAGQRIGLDRKCALTAAAHALADGITFWRQSSTPVEDLMQEAQTPGGIAAAVIRAMDQGGYPRLVQKALRSGLARARANSRL
jgi:pyrroline-5-carboxylate reductase